MFAKQFSMIHDEQMVAAFDECVQKNTYDVIQIDLRTSQQAGDAMAILAKRAQFPDYFGGNLDALYDVACEYALSEHTNQHLWLIRSMPSQEKMLFPMLDTLRDALSESKGLTILWWING